MGVPYAEVIGDPIGHSKSPMIHNFWLEKLGLPYEYRSRRVSPEDLPTYLNQSRRDPLWCGASVTIPHKQAVMGYIDRLESPAGAIGAVNAITRESAIRPQLVGHNTDAAGFLEPLYDWLGRDWRYRHLELIGTGGAAAAVAWALTQEGFLLIVHSRSDERGAAFRRRFAEPDADFVQPLASMANPQPIDLGPRHDTADILVNATPLGMTGYPPLPLDPSGHPPGAMIYDLVYDPVETELIRVARESGHPVISGIEMLIAQAARAFELFFGVAAPRQHDVELRELLTS